MLSVALFLCFALVDRSESLIPKCKFTYRKYFIPFRCLAEIDNASPKGDIQQSLAVCVQRNVFHRIIGNIFAECKVLLKMIKIEPLTFILAGGIIIGKLDLPLGGCGAYSGRRICYLYQVRKTPDIFPKAVTSRTAKLRKS